MTGTGDYRAALWGRELCLETGYGSALVKIQARPEQGLGRGA